MTISSIINNEIRFDSQLRQWEPNIEDSCNMPKYSLGRLINCIDLEMLCDPNAEIAEVGITEVDLETRTVVRTHTMFTKPDSLFEGGYTTRFKKLTGIPFAKLAKASPINGIYSGFKSFNIEKRPFVVFGDDVKHLNAELNRKGLKRVCKKEIDLSLLLKAIYPSNKAVSQKTYLERFGLVPEYPLHRAGPDSHSLAKLFIKFINVMSSKNTVVCVNWDRLETLHINEGDKCICYYPDLGMLITGIGSNPQEAEINLKINSKELEIDLSSVGMFKIREVLAKRGAFYAIV